MRNRELLQHRCSIASVSDSTPDSSQEGVSNRFDHLRRQVCYLSYLSAVSIDARDIDSAAIIETASTPVMNEPGVSHRVPACRGCQMNSAVTGAEFHMTKASC